MVLGHSSITITMDLYGHMFAKTEDGVELFARMEQELMAA